MGRICYVYRRTAFDTEMNKTVLMVAYHFPPCSEAGVYRTLRFSKYLREFGWEPVILTVKNGVFSRHDVSLSDQVLADLTVIRARAIDPLAQVSRRALTTRYAVANGKMGSRVVKSLVGIKALRQLGKWAYQVAETWVFVPDQRIGWIPFAVWQGLAFLRKHQAQVIYSSGGPWSAHLIAALLKRMTGLPWVADYRDFWTLYRDPILRLPRVRLWFEALLEHTLMRYSDLNVFVNEPTRDGYLKKYPDLAPARMRTLTNGFDPADFRHQVNASKQDKLVILHAGTASVAVYALEPFFRAVRNWFRLNPQAQEKVQLRFVGELGDNARFIAHYDLTRVVSAEAPVSHREVTQLMQESSVLLIVLGDHPPETLPMKTLEYLAAGRPIWAVAVEGATTEIVRSSGCGWISPPQDEDAIRCTLDTIWQAYCEGQLRDLRPSPDFVARFDGRQLTGRLACWLDELVA